MDAPFGTVTEAVGAAGEREVALFPGTYAETLVLSSSVTLTGACRDEVVLDGGGGADGTATLELDAGGTLVLSHVTVRGGKEIGLLVDGGTALVTDVVLAENTDDDLSVRGGGSLGIADSVVRDPVASSGTGVGVYVADAGSNLTATGLEVSGATEFGVVVYDGAGATLEGGSITGTVAAASGQATAFIVADGASGTLDGTVLSGNAGMSITGLRTSTAAEAPSLVLDGLDVSMSWDGATTATAVDLDGAIATISGSTFTGSSQGVLVFAANGPSDVRVTDTTITGVGADATVGVYAQGDATVTLDGVDISGMNSGVYASGADMVLKDCTLHDLSGGQSGVGAAADEAGGLTIEGGEIAALAGTAVSVYGNASLEATGVSIHDITAASSGTAAGVSCDGGNALLTGLDLHDIVGAGVLVGGGCAATVTDCVVEGLVATDSGLGWALGAVDTEGVLTQLDVKNTTVTGCEGDGLMVVGTLAEATASGLTFSGNEAPATNPDLAAAAVVATLGGRLVVDDVYVVEQVGSAVLVDGEGTDEDPENAAEIVASGLTVDDLVPYADHPAAGFVAVRAGSFTCEDCAFSDAGDVTGYVDGGSVTLSGGEYTAGTTAGLVVQGGGALVVDDVTVDATGSPFGVLGDGRSEASTLSIDGGEFGSATRADVYLLGAGAWRLTGANYVDAVGSDYGSTVLDGAGVLAAEGTTPWDDTLGTGLWIDGGTFSGNAGPAVLLVDASALVCDLSFSDDGADAVVQEACVSAEGVEVCDGDPAVDACIAEATWPYADPSTIAVSYEPGDVLVEWE